MNYLKLIIFFTFLLEPAAFSFAQVKTPTTNTKPTKMFTDTLKRPWIRDIQRQMHDLHGRIQAAIKSGKISRQNAKPLFQKVTIVQTQMDNDFKQNKNHGATEDQFNQLNSLLKDASTAIDNAIGNN